MMKARVRKALWWALPLVLLASALMAWYVLPWWVKMPASLFEAHERGIVYHARDGTPLRHLLNEKEERVGQPMALHDIPKVLVDATLAAEDNRFYSHGGVDFLAIMRAILLNAKSGRVVSGASTITQQLIKVATDDPPKRTFSVKLMEMLQARQLEMRWSKTQILETYLNRISYGNQLTGCAIAIQGYFNKPPRHLSLAEASMLAAIPQSPARLNPFTAKQAVKKRQLYVLHRMLMLQMIGGEEHGAAAAQAIVLQRFRGGFAAPHAVELDHNSQLRDEKDITCTIDPRLQSRVEQIVAQRLTGLREKHVEHAAVVVIDNKTRQLLALVGSRDYFSPHGGQLNGAWIPRSPGSALKPFTYSLAFSSGSSPSSIVADLPIEFPTETGIYKPENYGKKYYGPMTYRDALGNSLNVSAVKVLAAYGGTMALLGLLQKCGLTTLHEDAAHYGLGLTIGNAPVRLVELTNAYATLANLGMHQSWTLRLNGAVNPPTRVMDESAAWMIADVLSDNQARAMVFGRNSVIRLPFKVAVKTGTSTSYRDNWTLGYTPEFTVGVWAGNFESEPMQGISGVTGAGPIFRAVFTFLKDTAGTTWYADPTWLTRGRIDPRTGRRVVDSGPEVRLSRSEVFHKDHLPAPVQATDYEEGTGKAILPPEYKRWAESADNWLHGLVTTDADHRFQKLTITSPLSGAVVVLDPDLPAGGSRLLLRAEPADAVEWKCDTLKLTKETAGVFAELRPGSHIVAAIRRGQVARSTFLVKKVAPPP
jgi:penicillin-binding protein 1C